MKKKGYSVTPFWDKAAMNEKTKQSRIMITVNNVGNQFRITLNLRATKAEFDKAASSSRAVSEEVKEVRRNLNDYLMKAETILERLDTPTKEVFTRLFKSDTDLCIHNKTSIVPFFQFKISRHFAEEKFSTSSSVKLALNSLLKYQPEINFEDIDNKFLKGYVAYMLSKGNSITTAGIYLTNLRTVFNEVIKEGIIAQKHYPFKGFKFGGKVKSKAVLYPAQLKQFFDYEAIGFMEKRAKAYWLLCYLSNGMNFQDAALLQFKNIQGDIMTFVRRKTRSSGGKEIKVYMHDLAKEIILEFGNKSKSPDDYVLGFLTDKMSAFTMQQILKRYKKVTNKSLSTIGIKLGFEVHLCLNLARHTYATKMKIAGVPIGFIGEAMGHTSTTTTEHYLKSLPNENLKIMASNLLSF